MAGTERAPACSAFFGQARDDLAAGSAGADEFGSNVSSRATLEENVVSVPSMPPLNGRNLAEFYVASEASKRTILREYAKPPQQQQARIIMYDSIRRIVPDYFKLGRGDAVLLRTERFLAERTFANAEFSETWHKSNLTAIANLRRLQLKGEFVDVRTGKTAIAVGKLRVLSTADFYGRYCPAASNARQKMVAVIVNPSGVRKPQEKRKTWIAIESEVAIRAALNHGLNIEEVMYFDLPKNEITRHVGAKKTVWAEIDATCERIFRDWREIRMQMSQGESGTA